MNEIISSQIKDAFFLAFGPKTFRNVPLRFNITDQEFVMFLKQHSDIEIRLVEYGAEKYYLLTNIKHTQRQDKTQLSALTMLVLLYLDFEVSEAFTNSDSLKPGFFTSTTIQRLNEKHEHKIEGKQHHELNMFHVPYIIIPQYSDDDATKAVELQIHNIIHKLFDVKRVMTSYDFDINCMRRFYNKDMKQSKIGKMKLSFCVKDFVNPRTSNIPQLYFNYFSDLMKYGFDNQFINEGCPELSYNPTNTAMAFYLMNRAEATFANQSIYISVSDDNETAYLSLNDYKLSEQEKK